MRCMKPSPITQFLGGVALGAIISATVFAWKGNAPPTPAPPASSAAHMTLLAVTIMDENTNQPVRGDVTLWRSNDDDPLMLSDVQETRLEIPAGQRSILLVEAEGFRDWELSLSPREGVKALSGPVRLRRR